jgi:hypothetical protein
MTSLKSAATSCFGILVLCFWLSNCAYENEEELFGATVCNPDPVSYNEYIKPLMLTKCAIPECHDGKDRSIHNYLIFGIVKNRSRFIREEIDNRTMPPSDSGIQLSAQEIANINCWIEDGSLNN